VCCSQVFSYFPACQVPALQHAAAPLPVHLKWVSALEEEFFRQGDAELAAGLPISPLFDRRKTGITKSQVGFFDIVVIPSFYALTRVFQPCQPLFSYVMRNYKAWADQAAVAANAAANSA
jgi:cAMP-specific phosphodiesterase 4